jgi:hypothetical protein
MTIISAAPDWFVVHADKTFNTTSLVPIIAWRIEPDEYPIPITLEGEQRDDNRVYKLPNGRFKAVSGQTFDDAAEVIDWWDRPSTLAPAPAPVRVTG